MVINYSCTVNVPSIVDLTLVARYKITRPKARNPLRIVRKSDIVRNIPFDFSLTTTLLHQSKLLLEI